MQSEHMTKAAEAAARVMWAHRGRRHPDADDIHCGACDWLGSTYPEVLSHQIDELINAGLLADWTCTRCRGTGRSTDVRDLPCPFCQGLAELVPERHAGI